MNDIILKKPALPSRLADSDLQAQSRGWVGGILRLLGFKESKRKPVDPKNLERIDWLRAIPYIMIHAACLAVIWVGFSWTALAVCLALYALRVFAVTAFYHRYFSHKSFRTSRFAQFVFALIGCSAAQRGPLWWAAHHRHHHTHSDDEADFHSPIAHSILWSHMGWFLTPKALPTNWKLIPDLAKFRELRFLNRFDLLIPFLLAVGLWMLGEALGRFVPSTGTDGWQMLIWGFFVSTVLVYHVTYLVNSVAHLVGSRRFKTKDDSRNNFLVALLTFGEGWHNNHHRYPASVRQGFYWWEIDITYYTLCVLARLGIIWDLKPVPARVLAEGRQEPG